eukprot:2150147-Amphidinium_carterae.1
MKPPPPKAAPQDEEEENWGPWTAQQQQPPAAPTPKTRAPVPPERLRRHTEAIDDTLSEYIRGQDTPQPGHQSHRWPDQKDHKRKDDQKGHPQRGRKQRGGWQHKARTQSGKPWQDWKRAQEGRKDRAWQQPPQQAQEQPQDTPLQRARRRHQELQAALKQSGGRQRIQNMKKFMEGRALPKPMPKRSGQQKGQWTPKPGPHQGMRRVK